ncbi:MAG TPA: hypothetical protein VNX15_02695 [Gemmatimonadales bacterium]|nr:hypothetical protein [Gemmatimonadales bacterium]
MSTSKILVDDRKAGGFAGSTDLGWAVLWWVGMLFSVVSLADIALAYYPMQWGSMEWEFGTAASTFASLPLVALGLGALLATSLARGRRGWVIAVSVVLLLLALQTLYLLGHFLLDIPVAIKSVASADMRLGIQKAAVKTVGLGVLFTAAFLIAGIRSLLRVRRR